MVTHKEIGSKLKEARLQANFTQDEVSSTLAMSRQKLLKVEKGEGPIDTVLLSQLASLYGYSLDYFLSDEHSPERETHLAFRTDLLTENDQSLVDWGKQILRHIHDLNEIESEANQHDG
ncbi:helix-turn-helix domain-containing protein [Alkalibacillus sp. S2W]|uniref:helix-turn-helix domain-containing protein n=1 Tax=Alkalibacillus sp. S2W TaxID=3386553 RepID=UPI00398D321B